MKNFSISEIIRICFILLMSIYLSIGHVSIYFEFFEAYEIELAEEKNMDSKEKEGKEEIEKEEFIGKLFSFQSLCQEKYHWRYSLLGSWKNYHGNVDTPPPESA